MTDVIDEADAKVETHLDRYDVPMGAADLCGAGMLECAMTLAMADLLNWGVRRGLDVNRAVNLARRIHHAETATHTDMED